MIHSFSKFLIPPFISLVNSWVKMRWSDMDGPRTLPTQAGHTLGHAWFGLMIPQNNSHYLTYVLNLIQGASNALVNYLGHY